MTALDRFALALAQGFASFLVKRNEKRQNARIKRRCS